MKNYLLSISILKYSIFAFIGSLVFIIFFTSKVYKSESVIDVNTNQTESFATSITNSFLPSVGTNDAFQVMLYLQSNESSNLLRKEYKVDKFFLKDEISFFSKFRDNRFQNFHNYLTNKISITSDGDSGTLTIATYAFVPQDAKSLNLSLVDITANFFNRKARLAAINSRSGKICELLLTNTSVIDMATNEINNIEPLIEINEVNSLNQLLINKAENFKEYCIRKINDTSKSLYDSNENSLNIPAFELRSINVEAAKNIITQIYEDSLGAISEAEYIDVIVEPVIPDKAESRLAVIISLIIFCITFLTLVAIKICIRLSDEFSF